MRAREHVLVLARPRPPAPPAAGRCHGRPSDRRAEIIALRYLDVCLVLATAPFVLAGNLPVTGYLIGAGAWLLTRARHRFHPLTRAPRRRREVPRRPAGRGA